MCPSLRVGVVRNGRVRRWARASRGSRYLLVRGLGENGLVTTLLPSLRKRIPQGPTEVISDAPNSRCAELPILVGAFAACRHFSCLDRRRLELEPLVEGGAVAVERVDGPLDRRKLRCRPVELCQKQRAAARARRVRYDAREVTESRCRRRRRTRGHSSGSSLFVWRTSRRNRDRVRRP
jgi:hypothetical protein